MEESLFQVQVAHVHDQPALLIYDADLPHTTLCSGCAERCIEYTRSDTRAQVERPPDVLRCWQIDPAGKFVNDVADGMLCRSMGPKSIGEVIKQYPSVCIKVSQQPSHELARA